MAFKHFPNVPRTGIASLGRYNPTTHIPNKTTMVSFEPASHDQKVNVPIYIIYLYMETDRQSEGGVKFY